MNHGFRTLEKYVRNWIAIAAPFQGIGRILGNGGKVIASDLSHVAVAVAANNVQRYCLQEQGESMLDKDEILNSDNEDEEDDVAGKNSKSDS
ncbi:peptide chain release factor N(5)-glutamine methyltransferase [Trifolium repens]|nr:peptide chain release factor N(5)-glutamine methyltransferase [Trifolium repens]